MNFGFSSVVLIAYLIRSGDGFQSFNTFAFCSNVQVDVSTYIKNKAIALIHRGYSSIHLSNADISFALDLKQAFFKSIGIDMRKTGRYTAW